LAVGTDFGAGFVAVEEAGAAGSAGVPLADCPATGSTVIDKESRPAMQRAASRESEFGEVKTLISSL
jgi:hypothetical protein